MARAKSRVKRFSCSVQRLYFSMVFWEKSIGSSGLPQLRAMAKAIRDPAQMPM